MNIGLVRRGYSDTGGAESYLKRFAGALAEGGQSSLLFTASSKWTGAWPFGEVRVVAGESRAFADAFAAEEARSRCDTVSSPRAGFELRLLPGRGRGARRVARTPGTLEPGWKARFRNLQPKHRALLELESSLFKDGGAAFCIANSNMVKEEIIQHFGYEPARIRVIYNGVSPAAPSPGLRAAARARLHLAEGAFTVLFAGSGWDQRGCGSRSRRSTRRVRIRSCSSRGRETRRAARLRIACDSSDLSAT